MDCLFCKIIKKEIDSYLLYEDDLVIVILDKFPVVDGHTLIIPKKHYEDFTELDKDILIHINKVSVKITNLLMKTLNTKKISHLYNYGESQIIKHFHLHLTPDYPGKPTKSVEEVYNEIKKNI